MTPLQFFDGDITGFGVVLSVTGKVLRRFEVEMHGAWAEEHRALHLDETYRYLGGVEFKRSWAIHGDDDGAIIGHDALEAARMRGHQRGRDFRIVFDRHHRPPGWRLDPPQIMDFVEIGADDCLIHGRVRLLGVTLASIHVALTRIANHAA